MKTLSSLKASMKALSPFESMQWQKTLSSLKCKWGSLSSFESMQWLKTLSSSKCKWGSLSPFESMQWLKTWSSSKCKWRSLSPFESMQWLKTLSSLKCKEVANHNCLRTPSDLIVSGWQRRLLYLGNIKKNGWPWWSPHGIRLDCFWMAKVRMTMMVFACYQTWLSLDGEGADDHDSSPRAIKLDCFRMARVRMTMICLRMPTDSLVSGWQGWRMTIICLRVPMVSLVSGWHGRL